MLDPTWGLNSRTQDNGNPVVGPDGTIYLPTLWTFFALNPDGTTKWTSEHGSTVRAAPAVSLTRGVVYVIEKGAGGPELFALSSTDGSVVWSLVLDASGAFFSYSSLAIGADETIYVGLGSKQGADTYPAVAAVNPNGTLRWKFVDVQSWLANTAVETPPAVAPDGTVYVVENVGGLVAISSTGQFLWAGNFGGGYAWPTPAVGPDGTIYLAGETGVAYQAPDISAIAFRPDGTVKWRRDDLGPAEFFGGIAISSDGTRVYRTGREGTIHALDAATGATIWQTQLDSWHGGLGGSPLLDSNGFLYVQCTYGQLHVFDAQTGAERWYYDLNSGASYWGTQSPALGPDGSVYAVAPGVVPAYGDLPARLYAFHPTLGCVTTISPAGQAFTPDGGTGSISVTSNCAWEAVSTVPSWLTVTSGGSGTGNGTVNYSVGPNTGVGRTGILAVTGQTFAVDQLGPVTDIGAPLIGLSGGSAAWGDYDGDGDLDIVIVGWDGTVSQPVSRVYRNDGNGVFTDIGAPLPPVHDGTAAWGDFDNDGDLDIALTGVSGIDAFLEVYRNDGGLFTKAWSGSRGFSYASSAAWGDYDGDGRLDILYSAGGTALYHNDGNGAFTLVPTGLPFVDDFYGGAAAFADYDRDGDLDILLAGRASSGRIAKLFRNDGGGVFTDVGASLTGVDHPAIAWGDFDNDGDPDILLTGNDGTQRIAKVYRNDGGGVFTDVGASLTGVEEGSVAWGDYDNDGMLDILLAGSIVSGPVSKVYRNTGGAFVEAAIPPLAGVDSGSAAWGDFDNDGDLDILLNGGLAAVTKVYRNEVTTANTVPTAPTGLLATPGVGLVTLSWTAPTDAQTPAPGLTCNIRVGTTPGGVDVVSPMAATATGLRRLPAPGNGTRGTTAVLGPLAIGTYHWSVQAIDTALAGSPFASEGTFTISQTIPIPLTVTKAGQGAGTITSAPTGISCGSTCSASFPYGTVVTLSAVATAGTFSGWSGEGCSGTGTCQLSLVRARSVTATFTDPVTDIEASLIGTSSGSADWGDYDGDGDLDALIVGWDGTVSARVARLYRNDGSGVFTDIGAPLTPVHRGTAAWGDYDNDGDLDLVLTGSAAAGYVVEVYRNDDGTFTRVWSGSRGFSWASSVTWGDYDNDGRLDILFQGGLTALFHNDGNGTFTRILPSLPTVEYGSAAFGDYDQDGDLDILLVGRSGTERIAKLYRNDGGGVFTDSGVSLTGVDDASVAWGDFDDDGDPDILLAGYDGTQGIAEVYRNDGGGLFTDTGASLPGVHHASVAWGDYDNDGDLDILLAGEKNPPFAQSISGVFRNTAGVFADTDVPLAGVQSGSVAWGDYDNDGDLDLLLNGGMPSITRIYRNESAVANTVPAAPGALGASEGSGLVTLSWAAATDAQTPSPGLTYNIRVGTTPGGVDVVSPMASTASGLRRVPAGGNATAVRSAILASLPPGTYSWSVQAIDAALGGSAFAAEESFVVHAATYSLTVTKAGTGSGTVSSAPAGISCGATCSASFGYAAAVTLSAAAAAGSSFTGWSGEGCSGTGTCQVSMTQARNVTATFTLNTYALTVNRAGTGAGTVTSAPAGISCGATCSFSFGYGTGVTLSAAATPGSTFTGWSGEGCTGTDTCQVAMTQARSVTASFAAGPPSAKLHSVAPCRVLDTRSGVGPQGGPALAGSSQRIFAIAGPPCGIPLTARAVCANVTVTEPQTAGNLRVYPGDGPAPLTSTINFRSGQTRANNAILTLSTDDRGTIGVQNDASGTVHLILDVSGYFE